MPKRKHPDDLSSANKAAVKNSIEIDNIIKEIIPSNFLIDFDKKNLLPALFARYSDISYENILNLSRRLFYFSVPFDVKKSTSEERHKLKQLLYFIYDFLYHPTTFIFNTPSVEKLIMIFRLFGSFSIKLQIQDKIKF